MRFRSIQDHRAPKPAFLQLWRLHCQDLKQLQAHNTSNATVLRTSCCPSGRETAWHALRAPAHKQPPNAHVFMSRTELPHKTRTAGTTITKEHAKTKYVIDRMTQEFVLPVGINLGNASARAACAESVCTHRRTSGIA